jgi:hypothetical protein
VVPARVLLRKRLQRLRERPTLNFAAGFEEYERSLVPATGSTFARDVALRAFESLAALGVLEAADTGGAAGGRWARHAPPAPPAAARARCRSAW